MVGQQALVQVPVRTTPLSSGAARLLTKSRFKLAYQCPTKLFYSGKSEYGNKLSDDTFLKALAYGGFQVGKLAQFYIPGGSEITTKDHDEALAQTEEMLRAEKAIIYEGAFRYENLFIRADIAVKDGAKLNLYEVKSKSWEPGETFWLKNGRLDSRYLEYLYDVAFQYHVISKSKPGLWVTPFLLMPNKQAVATVDGLNQKFRISPQNSSYRIDYDADLKPTDLGEKLLMEIMVRNEVQAILGGTDRESSLMERQGRAFDDWVHFLSEKYSSDTKIIPILGNKCKRCEFRIQSEYYFGKKSGFDECWEQAANATSQDSGRARVFDLWRFRSAQRLIDQKIYYLDQLKEADIRPQSGKTKRDCPGLTDHERRMKQIDMLRHNTVEPYVDLDGLMETMPTSFPLHFIDFETAIVAIPFHAGRRPYEQIAFQFSHHTACLSGKVEHAGQWICTEPGTFPNFHFLRALKKEVSRYPGTILRYGAHENTVLCQIFAQLKHSSEPDRKELCEWIQTIAEPTKTVAEAYGEWTPDRPMVDMLDLVKRFYLHPKMGGSNSLKAVLPAVLNSSRFLKRKYGRPIYGSANGIPSSNFRKKQWVRVDAVGLVDDPYASLPKIFPDHELNGGLLDFNFGQEDSGEVRDGGAAMMAYCRLQFSDLTLEQRKYIEDALLRYCELDTLAMVMLWEEWRALCRKREKNF